MANVNIKWNWLHWTCEQTWGRDVWPELQSRGVKLQDLERCVYVIRLNGFIAIEYPKGISPTLYIGEGNFEQRITQHKNWLLELADLQGNYQFLIAYCFPRARNASQVYSDFEANLIHEFRDTYGAAPLRNKQMEFQKAKHTYGPTNEIRKAIMIGSGTRFHWAVKPMKSSPMYDVYQRTMLEEFKV
ncbi:hypothetical protein IFR08_15185 [Pseudomonas fluorescens]|uniref:GIY-YIG domain-containing protein n=1 Tax=Pseudomonas fluorescens TaxID=294 RepID=A0A2N1E9N1_PSEFL|nr:MULTISPECIES: hypothetical protein [Pseudomonas]MBD8099009.1 hypothetical protein [Pseudomonas fluorescens]MBD8775097.1 hypothetical protein [Pseudomonas fluorescens]MBD8780279.1 hypothetical protein [Pseudomonas fluorescens]MBD8797533.1 hypothetical protein [Pseudomonas fluorescens]PKH23059.1 hypothetical protein CIB54_09565 [Pseudomonas fluorescens]